MERVIGRRDALILGAGALITGSLLIPSRVEADEPLVEIPTHLIPRGYRLTDQIWQGTASYYSVEGCLGCSIDRVMANGEPFDENRLTLAFMRAPLGSLVIVTNTKNGTSAIATITDRGNFERYGRIADLSLGLKEAIQGQDLTPVKIGLLESVPVRSIPSSRGAFWRGWGGAISE